MRVLEPSMLPPNWYHPDNISALCEVDARDIGGCRGPQSLAGEQIRRVQLRDPHLMSWRAHIAEGWLCLIATLHDPAVIRKILAPLAVGHSGQSPAPPSQARRCRGGRRRAGAARSHSC